ncbi:bleomycin resistance family protein [Cytophagales bacterium WSM2-2]|nr:bleomycin resistance family protein [Cytophagales bacterium WSM2-2]
MDTLSPNIFVKDMNATLEFYKNLGFEVLMSMPETGNYDWAMLGNGNVTFMFQTYSSLGDALPEISRKDGGSLLFYIKMKGLRALFEKIKGKAKVAAEINKTFYGATEFSIIDNNGYVLTFAEDE